MQCHHFDAFECRSCTLLDIPRQQQVSNARARIEGLLQPFIDPQASQVWGDPILGPESGFRARGKMAVAGTAAEPVLGLPGQAIGADLSDCPLYPPGVEEVLDGVRALIRRAQVPPYNVARRRGELKNVLVTASPDGDHALRLVLRSEQALGRIREHLPALLAAHPSVIGVSANIHPEHTTRVEGEQEIHLAGTEAIAVRTGDVTLQARPQSFLQTNTPVAGQLYRQAAEWTTEIAGGHSPARLSDAGTSTASSDLAPLRIWDLYCGLGGFALHLARALPAAEVTGVEASAQAIDGAREAAAAQSLPARFVTADATAWAGQEAVEAGAPDVVVVNPPRRGIGPELASWIQDSGVRDVLYSSCHPTSLATDLETMGALRIVAGRFVDMFPHTEHAEVIVRLRRVG